jgi:hypothetical protein
MRSGIDNDIEVKERELHSKKQRKKPQAANAACPSKLLLPAF